MSIISVFPDKELGFKKPFSSVVKQIVTIQNTSNVVQIAFKIKTTAPKQYCVRPNSGRLAPGESMQVQVLLQAMKEDPSDDFKCKDKFLIQAIKVPHDAVSLEGDAWTNRLAEMWQQAEAIKKQDANAAADIIEEAKLRVVFLSSTISNSSPTTMLQEYQAYSASNSSAVDAQTEDVSFVNRPSTYESTTTHFDTFQPSTQQNMMNNARATVSTSPAANYTHEPSFDEIQKTEKELKESKEVIKKLTMACDGYRTEIERLNVLRQRKIGSISESVSTPAISQQYQQPGLPIQMVALIGFFAFVLGVLLF